MSSSWEHGSLMHIYVPVLFLRYHLSDSAYIIHQDPLSVSFQGVLQMLWICFTHDGHTCKPHQSKPGNTSKNLYFDYTPTPLRMFQHGVTRVPNLSSLNGVVAVFLEKNSFHVGLMLPFHSLSSVRRTRVGMGRAAPLVQGMS